MASYREARGEDSLFRESAKNDAVGLKSYLQDVDAAVRNLPSAWVKCELHVLKVADKFVRMEFVELDSAGRQVAKAHGGCFPNVWQRIDAAFRAVGLPLEAGSQVLVKLDASVNAAYGFNVSVLDIDVNFSLGDLNARIQAIRRNIQDAGHWDRNRRLRKPGDFTRVAVISPSGAAGLGDFRSTADRLHDAGLTTFHYHEAPFQTRGAPGRIIEILRGLYRDCMDEDRRYDAIAIIRGGGASTDLAWLIDEKLTEAVCRMNVPVMTGIGHERDKNLLDEVACIPCDTPSKVAEHISRTVTQAALAGERASDAIRAQVRQIVDRARSEVAESRHAIGRDATEIVRLADVAVRTASTEMEPGARLLIDEAQIAVTAITEQARAGARGSREAADAGLRSVIKEIEGSASASLHQLDLGCSRATSEMRTRLEAVPDAVAALVSEIAAVIRTDATEALEGAGATIVHLSETTQADAVRTLDACQSAIAIIEERADALHPRTVMAAGYAILRNDAGEPLTGIDVVKAAETIKIDMRDGTVTIPVKPKKTTRKAKTA